MAGRRRSSRPRWSRRTPIGLAGGPARLLAEVLALAAGQGADDVSGSLLGRRDEDADGALPDGARAFPPGTPPDDVVAWLRAVSR